MDVNAKSNYIPALKYNWLTQFYDGWLNAFLRLKAVREIEKINTILGSVPIYHSKKPNA